MLARVPAPKPRRPNPAGLLLTLTVLVLGVSQSGCTAILNNDPDLRWFVFSHFGASRICPEMIKTSVPIRNADRAPAIGRFFPKQCTCNVDDKRRVITVSIAGTGYAYVNPAKRVGFAVTAAVEYRPDFRIAGKDLYLWARVNRLVDGPRFQLGYVENPIVDAVGNLPGFGNIANVLGNQAVTAAMTRGFTVIRNDDNPDHPDFTLGVMYPPEKPHHPFQVVTGERFTVTNEVVDIEANQRDYFGPFEVASGQSIFLSTTVQGPPIDVILVNKDTGDAWREAYQTGKPLGPPPGPVFGGNPVLAGPVDSRRYNVPPGFYYIVLDNTPYGTVGPALPSITNPLGALSPLGLGSAGSVARVSFVAQLGK
jgi:hypothetical protein